MSCVLWDTLFVSTVGAMLGMGAAPLLYALGKGVLQASR